MRTLLVFVLLTHWACDDGSQNADTVSVDAGLPQSDTMTVQPDVSVDAQPPAKRALPQTGLWAMAVEFVDVGGIILHFQLAIETDEMDAITELVLRAVATDGSVSEALATLTDIAIDDDSQFEAAFLNIVLPGAYSPTGSPLPASLTMSGSVRDATFMCGQVSGEVASLGITLTMSTFGAVPWGEPVPASCDADPIEMVERPTIGGDVRPAKVFLPDAYDGSDEDWPLVILLHGFSATGEIQDGYLGLSRQVNELGFIMVLPEGTRDANGDQFWDATKACCGDREVDDVAYLSGLITEAKSTYGIDADRVYLVGHSNGGFMSYRLACEIGDQLAAIVPIAGATLQDMSDCTNAAAVSVLHIHALDDLVIPYVGRPGPRGYPSAEAGVARWAARGGCEAEGVSGERVDMVPNVQGDETIWMRWPGCRDQVKVELLKLEEGGHVPGFGSRFTDVALPWILERRRAP